MAKESLSKFKGSDRYPYMESKAQKLLEMTLLFKCKHEAS